MDKNRHDQILFLTFKYEIEGKRTFIPIWAASYNSISNAKSTGASPVASL